ncbi:MAG: hypothetical protein ACYS7Y_32985 [Planctomycetota bacterium]
MTAKEQAALESLRRDLASYHVEVREHIVESESWRRVVDRMHSDLYGLPGERESTGLMGEVHSLKRSRASLIRGMKAVWAVLSLAIGAAATVIFGR